MNLLNFINYRLARESGKKAHRQWVKDNAESLRIKYKLNQDAIVFDLGGYEGSWTNDIFDRFGCNIYTFEPVCDFYDKIVDRFKDNSKIKVYNFGLSNKDYECKIYLDDDGSSVYKNGGKYEVMQMKQIDKFFKEQNISKIDLMKINIEGGEFDLLEHLLTTDYIKNIDNILIQFHAIKNLNCYFRRNNILKKLSKTHETTFNYPFVWESWQLKNAKK